MKLIRSSVEIIPQEASYEGILKRITVRFIIPIDKIKIKANIAKVLKMSLLNIVHYFRLANNYQDAVIILLVNLEMN